MYGREEERPTSEKIVLNVKPASFVFMLVVKTLKSTSFHFYVFTRKRHNDYEYMARRAPLIRHFIEGYFDERKADEGHLKNNDRMKKIAMLEAKLNCA